MHGTGLVGDLLHLGLYLATIVIWMHLWLLCVFNATGSLKRLLGSHARLFSVLGVPVVALILFGGSFSVFGAEGMVYCLLVLGLGLPLITLMFLRWRT
jgi:hypothetical protein